MAFWSPYRSISLKCIPRFTLCANVHTTQANLLYSAGSLGLDSYIDSRKRIQEQFMNYQDKFYSKMQEFVKQDKNMIFTEDLKNMVHLAKSDDIELVCSMIKKFNKQKSNFRFGSFHFGPVVMRMFHHLDAPKEALKCFEDPENNGFFDQQSSHQILLDLLYNHQMYDEIYKVFETIQDKQLNMIKYPKYSVMIVFASCYKQNTPESFDYACKLWSQMTENGTVPLRRTSAYLAGLALKQGAPHIALEVIAPQKQSYITIRNIKAVALAEIGRVDDSLIVLKSIIDADTPLTDKSTFFKEAIDKVRQAAEKSKNDDIIREFQATEKALSQRNKIDNQTLDDLLSSEVTTTVNRPQFQQSTLMPNRRKPYLQNRKNMA